MNLQDFFDREVHRVTFHCTRCRIYDEPRISHGPAWLLQLQIQLQANGRRHNLLRILEAAGAVEFLPVTIEDVALSFEAEVISGAGPWHGLRDALHSAAQGHVDLATLTPEQLDRVDRAFTASEGYIHRVVTGLRRARAVSSTQRIYQALQAFPG